MSTQEYAEQIIDNLLIFPEQKIIWIVEAMSQPTSPELIRKG